MPLHRRGQPAAGGLGEVVLTVDGSSTRSTKHALVFMALALATSFVILQTVSPWWRGLMGWFVLNFFMMGLSYAAGSVALWGKRSDGTRALWSRVVLIPMGAMLTFARVLESTFSREDPYHQIRPNLWLGRRPTRREAADWADAFEVVIDATCEFTEPIPLRREGYLVLPTLDATAVSMNDLDQAMALIEQSKNVGSSGSHGAQRVLVHCASGHGRSAMIVAAWLMDSGASETVEDAVALLQSIRSGVGLNSGQRDALARWFVQSGTSPS